MYTVLGRVPQIEIQHVLFTISEDFFVCVCVLFVFVCVVTRMDINVKILNKIVWGTKTDIALLVKSISLCGEVQVVVKITNADTYQTTGESITVTTVNMVNCTTIKNLSFFL